MKRRDFMIAAGATLAALGLGRFATASDAARTFGEIPDFDKYKELGKLGCVWDTGNPCAGQVTEQDMFSKQIKLPICEYHLRDHMAIMALNNSGTTDLGEILELTPEERSKLVYEHMLRLEVK